MAIERMHCSYIYTVIPTNDIHDKESRKLDLETNHYGNHFMRERSLYFLIFRPQIIATCTCVYRYIPHLNKRRTFLIKFVPWAKILERLFARRCKGIQFIN